MFADVPAVIVVENAVKSAYPSLSPEVLLILPIEMVLIHSCPALLPDEVQ